ncbi:MAG: acetyl-CoA C-acetyltransferase [Ruminococcaceae bacterium]|nr:acetyl-CoA C-acetyltransferase [Oscillospiraceae bacterium]
MNKPVYILSACRTPIGSFGGALKPLTAVDLGKVAITEALQRAAVTPEQVDEVIFGNVLQGGQGQNPARQVAVAAGIPLEKPAVTINKVCGSGLYSVALAMRTIKADEGECLVAGGTESMSNVPYLAGDVRWGSRMGDVKLKDYMVSDGLWDVFNDYHMGITAENVAEKYGITREQQDSFAVSSQQKAAAAQREGRFAAEITAVAVPQRKGDPLIVDADEYIRPDTSLEKISRLKPAFIKDGTVTAANASGINDGAAALVIGSADFVEQNNLKPLARIVASASCGIDPAIMGMGPVPAIQACLQKAGLEVGDIDLFELNEAFASQSLAVCQELGLDQQKVNVNGGAIALGHPIGASGARILTSLLYEMARRKSRYGLAALCIGGGMGEAMIVELV